MKIRCLWYVKRISKVNEIIVKETRSILSSIFKLSLSQLLIGSLTLSTTLFTLKTSCRVPLVIILSSIWCYFNRTFWTYLHRFKKKPACHCDTGISFQFGISIPTASRLYLRQTSNEMISTVEARAPQLRASNGSEP